MADLILDTEADSYSLGSFTDAPVSIAEIRSERSESASDWTPRDALIAALRAIDKGEIAPESLIVAYLDKDPNPALASAKFFASSPNPAVTIGTLELVKLKMMRVF